MTALAQDEHLAQVRLRVIDEAQVPLARARVVLSTYTAWIPGRAEAGRDEYNTVLGATDTNGIVALSLKGSSGRYGFMVLPLPEFHWDRGKEYVFTNAVAGRWEPWNPVVTIVLKRKTFDYAPPAETVVLPGKGGDVSKDPLVARPQLIPGRGRP